MLAASFPGTRVFRASIVLAVTVLSVAVGAGSAAAESASVTLTVSPTAALPGAPVTLTATVTGSTFPAGTVSFAYVGASENIGTAVVMPVEGSSTTGQAVLIPTSLREGTYSITAHFSADDIWGLDPADATPVTLVVSPVPIHATTVTLTANPTTVVTGQPETFTAVVTRNDGTTPVPTGEVTFNDNGILLDTAPLVNGVATIPATGFIAGSHSVIALYSGDATNTPSSSIPLAFQLAPPVVAVQTTTTVTASPSRIVAGQSITLVAHVVQTGKKTSPPVGDNVIFYADDVLVGVAPLDANGNATLTKSGWLTHTYNLTASYVGNVTAGWGTSTGASQLALVVQDALAPLTVTGTSATIVYGSAVPAVATPVYTGFINGDTPASLTTRATCTTTATATSPVGTYPVTCTGASSPFYAIAYSNGTVTVQTAPLTVTANAATVVTGQPIPALTATISGFKNGQTLATSGVTGAPVCTAMATTTSPVGTYPITCTVGTLTSTNYTFTSFVGGTLTIAPPSSPVICARPAYDDDRNHDRGRDSVCEALLSEPSGGSKAKVGEALSIDYQDETPIGTGVLAPTAVVLGGTGQLLPVTVTASRSNKRYQAHLTLTAPSTLDAGSYSILLTVHDSDGHMDQWIWALTVKPKKSDGAHDRDDD